MAVGEYLISMEMLKLGESSNWTTVLQNNHTIYRSFSAIAAISESKILVYGGYLANQERIGYSNTGDIFQTEEKNLRPILGRDSDLKFLCYA